jgi:hypothetical protein
LSASKTAALARQATGLLQGELIATGLAEYGCLSFDSRQVTGSSADDFYAARMAEKRRKLDTEINELEPELLKH